MESKPDIKILDIVSISGFCYLPEKIINKSINPDHNDIQFISLMSVSYFLTDPIKLFNQIKMLCSWWRAHITCNVYIRAVIHGGDQNESATWVCEPPDH